jgi:Putative adhesin
MIDREEAAAATEMGGGRMIGRCSLNIMAPVFAAALLIAGCGAGAASNGSFDRTYTVSGPIRLDLSNAGGQIHITGSSGNTVHIHGEVHARGFLFNNPEKQARELSANPPIEQRPDIIRVGKNLSDLNGISVDYTIELPRNAEVSTKVASGSQTISNLQGPVKIDSASGTIEVSKIERAVQVNSASGSIRAQDLGDDFHASTASGNINATNVKGDVRIRGISSSMSITGPGARVEAATTSGSVEISGAGNDVTASSVAGRVSVHGNPSGNSYWNLKTTSGTVEVAVPPTANFHLSAQAVSGDINAGIPIVIEDQDKHSLRARVGNAGGRVEIHTVSGGIRVEPAS